MSKYELLTTSNPKTIKGLKKGFITAILHLSPSTKSGRNVCPFASPECIGLCLDEAGRGHTPVVQAARLRRTKMYFEQPEAFDALLTKEIEKFINYANKKDLIPTIRLNGTSDIPKLAIKFAKKFPDIQFYDYTKSIDTMNREDLPPNYHLTFSRSELNDSQAKAVLANGQNVAVVFDKRPKTYWGYPVIDGDETDLRFLDPSPVVVGLTFKGKKSKMESDFVVKTKNPGRRRRNPDMDALQTLDAMADCAPIEEDLTDFIQEFQKDTPRRNPDRYVLIDDNWKVLGKGGDFDRLIDLRDRLMEDEGIKAYVIDEHDYKAHLREAKKNGLRRARNARRMGIYRQSGGRFDDYGKPWSGACALCDQDIYGRSYDEGPMGEMICERCREDQEFEEE